MSPLLKTLAAVLIVLLAVTGYGYWATRPPASAAPVGALGAVSQSEAVGPGQSTVDESTLLTAQRLARLATTPEELPLARTAVQLADHELDLAFAGALRHIEAHPPVLSAEAHEIQDRLTNAQKQLASDSEQARRLTEALARAPDAGKPAIQDQLDLAQAQQQLDQDEVAQDNDDLMRAGGNEHQRIQMMQQEHEAAAQRRLEAPAAEATALASLKGLVGKVRQWSTLRRRERWLGKAQEHAAESAAQLEEGRRQIQTDLAARKEQAATIATSPPAGTAPGAGGGAAGAAPAATTSGAAPAASRTTLAARTREIAAEQSRVTIRAQRVAARKKLAETYGQWRAVVGTQANALLHSCLEDVAVVLAALLLLLFIDRWLETLLVRAPIDRRQVATLRSVVGVSCQLVGVVLILLVLIGLPGQLGTMIGLAGAGLTVALKDFIIGFLGWFVLMGKHGMRVGDWVEINGVSGEVVELGIFHTVLLETGNWTDAGHPTGRRVTFTNAFAIEGHYFNFSTTGQWLWDELLVMVPFGRDAHAIAEAIQKEVTAATAESTRQAEAEWQRAARGRKLGFTAQPGIAIRPAPGGGGVEIAVRYVTRAADRYALRSRLYQSAVQLLSQSKPAA